MIISRVFLGWENLLQMSDIKSFNGGLTYWYGINKIEEHHRHNNIYGSKLQ